MFLYAIALVVMVVVMAVLLLLQPVLSHQHYNVLQVVSSKAHASTQLYLTHPHTLSPQLDLCLQQWEA